MPPIEDDFTGDELLDFCERCRSYFTETKPCSCPERLYCPDTGKRTFKSQGEARRAMAGVRNRIRVYMCPHCQNWHATSSVQPRKHLKAAPARKRQKHQKNWADQE